MLQSGDTTAAVAQRLHEYRQQQQAMAEMAAQPLSPTRIHRFPLPPAGVRQTLSVSDMAVAIDDSGSTKTHHVLGTELQYVGQALHAVSRFRLSVENTEHADYRAAEATVTAGSEPLILWSDTARLVPPQTLADAEFHATRPSMIFEDPACRAFVDSRALLVLCTDGEIQEADVTHLARAAHTVVTQNVLNVGIITLPSSTPRQTAVSGLNVSVMAPLFVGQYVILLLHQDTFFVAATNEAAVLEHLHLVTLPALTSALTLDELPRFHELRPFLTGLALPVTTTRLPPEWLPLKSTETDVWAASWEHVVALASDPQAFATLQEWDWSRVLRHARLAPSRLASLRQALSTFRRRVTEQDAHECCPSVARALAEPRSLDSAEAVARARHEYTELRRQVLHEEYETRQARRHAQRPLRAFVEGLLSLLTEAESTGWKLSEVARGYAHRELRAATLD